MKKFLEKQDSRDRKEMSGCLGLRVEAGIDCMWAQWNFGGDLCVIKLGNSDDCTTTYIH